MESLTLGKVEDITKNKSIWLQYMVLDTRRWQRAIFERHGVVPDDMGWDWGLWIYGFIKEGYQKLESNWWRLLNLNYWSDWVTEWLSEWVKLWLLERLSPLKTQYCLQSLPPHHHQHLFNSFKFGFLLRY